MADSGPQRPDESDRDYMRRMMAVDAEKKLLRRLEATENSLRDDAEAARREKRQLKRQDDKWEDQMSAVLFGLTPDEVLNEGTRGADITPAERAAIEKVSKQLRKGNKSAARRAAKSSKARSAAKKAAKSKKSRSGCIFAGILMVGGFGGTAWALYEGAAALVSAMGR